MIYKKHVISWITAANAPALPCQLTSWIPSGTHTHIHNWVHTNITHQYHRLPYQHSLSPHLSPHAAWCLRVSQLLQAFQRLLQLSAALGDLESHSPWHLTVIQSFKWWSSSPAPWCKNYLADTAHGVTHLLAPYICGDGGELSDSSSLFVFLIAVRLIEGR